jgi:hypothetical protein
LRHCGRDARPPPGNSINEELFGAVIADEESSFVVSAAAALWEAGAFSLVLTTVLVSVAGEGFDAGTLHRGQRLKPLE